MHVTEKNGSEITVRPAALSGAVAAVPSKSHAHRLLLCGAHAVLGGTCPSVFLRIPAGRCSDDIFATLACLRALGVAVYETDAGITLSAAGAPNAPGSSHAAGAPGCTGAPDDTAVPELDCGESGSTLRFLLPFAALYRTAFRLTGRGRLPKRPMQELTEALEQHGLSFVRDGADFLPLTVSGTLTGGAYSLPGNVSSQYISGLLMALPVLPGPASIRLTTDLQSVPYIALTLETLRTFGVEWDADWENRVFRTEGGCTFHAPQTLVPEGDWSSASFWICANAMGAQITCEGLNPSSTQGDRAVRQLAYRVGGGARLDVSDVPDAVPVLAVTAACARGDTVFTGTARLRLKESDRVQAVCDMLQAVGVTAETDADQITVRGCGGALRGTEPSAAVDSCGDHRIAMAAAIAGTFSRSGVTIRNPWVTDKSYPGFYEDLVRLGGVIDGGCIR